MKKRIGVYAGSFKPFHVGHANVLHQALNVFDEMILAMGKNPAKLNIEREDFPYGNPILKGTSVVEYTGLLSDYLDKVELENEGSDVFLVRGLRNGDDTHVEQDQLQWIKPMYPSLKTVFFLCDKKFEHVSSTALRALKTFSESEYRKYTYRPVQPPEGPKYGEIADENKA